MAYDEKLINDAHIGMKRLLEIMRTLRDPEVGCPWDLKQNFASIAPFTIEEAYEVADAIERRNWSDLKSELGDLLLQTVYHTQIASELGLFNFDDVVNTISDKMVSRHPHVFTNMMRDKSVEEQEKDWEDIKAKERASKTREGVLDDVAVALPALVRALKLQKRAARVGFDWPNISLVLDKIREEAHELTEAKKKLTHAEIEEEYGDLMFVMVNFGRHLKVDAEVALRAANEKFCRRFKYIENELAKRGILPEQCNMDKLESLWNEAKAIERNSTV